MIALRQVGLLHTAGETGDRIRILEQSLAAAADPSGALIVLPEAINILNGYNHPPWCLDSNAQGRLSSLARAFDVVFIAGLIAGESPDLQNLACSIGPDETVWVAGKFSSDGKPYLPYVGPAFSPIDFHWRQVGTLICMDAFDFQETPKTVRDHCDGLLQALRAAPGHTPVLCVPAHTSHLISSKRNVGVHFVMANGGDAPSIIHLSGGAREELREAGLHFRSLLTRMEVVGQLTETSLVVNLDHRPERPLDGLERCVIVNLKDGSCSPSPVPLDSIRVHTHGALSINVNASPDHREAALEIARNCLMSRL